MVFDGTFFGAALAMIPLAALGLVTLTAFVLMPILGLVSEWSFRRIFFTSFAIGLLAPIIAGASIASWVQQFADGRDFRQVIADTIPDGEERMQRLEEAGQRVREIGEAAERGDITEAEAEQQIEQIIQEQTGLQIDLEDVEFSGDENGMRIQIE